MKQEYREQCLKCRFLAPKMNPPCGRVFKGALFIGPLGGTLTWEFMPGMVPVEMEEKLRDMLGQIGEFVTTHIQRWPWWDDYAKIMAFDPSKRDCPGREEARNPYLKVVGASGLAPAKRICNNCELSSGCGLAEGYDPNWTCPSWRQRVFGRAR